MRAASRFDRLPSGPSEILEGGVYGTLVPVGDEDALAAAMADALGNDYDQDRSIRRAAEFAPDSPMVLSSGVKELLAAGGCLPHGPASQDRSYVQP